MPTFIIILFVVAAKFSCYLFSHREIVMNGDKQAVQLVPMPFSETGKLEAAGIQVFLSSKNSNGLVVSLI